MDGCFKLSLGVIYLVGGWKSILQPWLETYWVSGWTETKIQVSCLLLNSVGLPTLSPRESESKSHSLVSDSLQPQGLYSLWNSPGQNTGVGSLGFSSGSSWPRNWTGVSCIAGRFLTNWAIREAHAFSPSWTNYNSYQFHMCVSLKSYSSIPVKM